VVAPNASYLQIFRREALPAEVHSLIAESSKTNLCVLCAFAVKLTLVSSCPSSARFQIRMILDIVIVHGNLIAL
jgi:hypothetical protein